MSLLHHDPSLFSLHLSVQVSNSLCLNGHYKRRPLSACSEISIQPRHGIQVQVRGGFYSFLTYHIYFDAE